MDPNKFRKEILVNRIQRNEKIIEGLEAKIKQLEDAINKVFAFRISTSFAENVNELAILQNELKEALGGK